MVSDLSLGFQDDPYTDFFRADCDQGPAITNRHQSGCIVRDEVSKTAVLKATFRELWREKPALVLSRNGYW